ncbi:MAG: inositol monophosphatase family protein [Verrucomicrobiota bacterium]
MSDSVQLTEWHEKAVATARAAGKRIAAAAAGELQINEETHHDLKIQLDVDTQNFIEAELLGMFPDHHILGEEGGSGNDGKGVEWIVDPIDGTVNLAYGIPHYCVSIACRVEGELVLGVIFDPGRDECFEAYRGGGARCNGQAIRVSPRTELQQAILSLGFSKTRESVEKCLDLYVHYARNARKLRAMGSAALDMAYVAAGRIDGYIEQGISIWDIAAGRVLIEEAGGTIVLTEQPGREKFHVKAWNGKVDLPLV